MCGLRITTEDGVVQSVRGDPDDPLSRGHICPKAVALKDLHEDPDRLRTPMRRTATGWHPLSWDDALDQAAAGLRAVQDRHGDDAVAVYLGNPTVHSVGAMLYAPDLIRALHTKNRYSATSVDQLPHHFAAYFMFGHQLLLPIPDLDRTSYMLMLGANPLASNGSIMSAPDVAKRLKAIAARGSLVVVDPRRTETAGIATTHHFIRPGTDALLLSALVRTVLEDGARPTLPVTGLEALQDAVAPFAPEAVASTVGIPAEAIRGIARDFSAADGAVCYARMGASTQPFGGLCQWLSNALNIVTGNLDEPGGAGFPEPAIDVVKGFLGVHRPGSFGRWRSRVRGLPEFGGELPVATLAEEMTTPGEGQIRGLLTHAGNPVLSTPDGVALDDALNGLEFMVSIDFYLNETTRHADLVLPPASPLERVHYDLIFHALAIRNTARFSPPIFDRPMHARHDWEILLGLETRLSRRSDVKTKAQRAMRARLGPTGLLRMAMREGPYGSGWKIWKDGLTLSALEAKPSGLDLGPLKPCLEERLGTKDGRIQLAPDVLVADLPRLEAVLAGGSKDVAVDGIVLIGRRELRSNNSWMHNSQRLVKGPERCVLLVHPDDAKRLGLADGRTATVTSRVGSVDVPVSVSDAVMPGVVSLPHGYGHGRDGVRLSVAQQRPGVSINDLTDPERLDRLTGNAALNGVPVEVRPV
jgi:anaerobic selenocysteine-containing dehydrogenase